MAKREKTVYRNMSEVAHVWVLQDKQESRCRNGFHEGEVIYSYGRHFPIARIYTDEAGKKTVFMTLDTYSNTTAQHIRDVSRACSHMDTLYMLNVITGNTNGAYEHEKNVKYWIGKIAETLDKVPRARDYKEGLVYQASRYVDALNRYMEFFKLKADKDTKKIITAANPENYTEEIRLYKEKKAAKEKYEEEHWDEVQQKREQDKIKRAEAKRVAAEKKYAEQIAEWRSCTGWSRLPRQYGGYDLLRYNPTSERIETSQSVQIPLETAKRFYNRIQAVVKKGGCSDNCSDKILDYEVKEINQEGIKVGCHNIQMQEIVNMAQQMQW